VSDLPRDNVVHDASDWPCCPWCRGDMSAATVRVGALCDIWVGGNPRRPWRGGEGQPDPDGLQTECPHCRRPSMIALQGDVGVEVFRLLAVRTKADVALLGGRWGRPL
jgi:hypothetical protein